MMDKERVVKDKKMNVDVYVLIFIFVVNGCLFVLFLLFWCT